MKPYLYLFIFVLIVAGCKKSTDIADLIKKAKIDTPINIVKIDTPVYKPPIKPDTGWHVIASLPGPRTYATGFTLNNKGYVCNGVIDVSDPHALGHDDMLMYDPVKNSWIKKAGLPKVMTPGMGRRRPFSFLINNKVYAGGGMSGNSFSSNDLYGYDTVADKWTYLTELEQGRWFNESMATTYNGKGYIASFTSGHNAFYVFDPITGTIKETGLGYVISGKLQSQSWLTSDGKDLFYGIYDNNYNFFFTLKPPATDYVLYPDNYQSWPETPPVGYQGAFYKGYFYMSFGNAGNLYRYNFSSKKWQVVILRNLGVTDGITTFLIGSKLYVVGGNNGIFSPSTNKAWVIDLDAYP